MTNQNAAEFKSASLKFKAFMLASPRKAGLEAVAFFKEGFRYEGQNMGTIIPWKKRKFETRDSLGKKVGHRSGTLVRDITLKSATNGRTTIGVMGASEDYAAIFNEGGQIPIIPKMRRFFWARYYEIQNRQSDKKVIHPEAAIWRNLALTSKSHLDVPARPIFYDSPELVKRLTRLFVNDIKKIFGF